MSSNSSVYEEEESSLPKQNLASSVIVFSIIFIILTIYSLIQRFLCRNNRTNSNQSGGEIPDESDTDHRHHSLVFQNRGLELDVIASLPMFEFKKSEGGEKEKAINRECAICLAFFSNLSRHLLNPKIAIVDGVVDDAALGTIIEVRTCTHRLAEDGGKVFGFGFEDRAFMVEGASLVGGFSDLVGELYIGFASLCQPWLIKQNARFDFEIVD
ncbi:E3 ubiquitin-protein ligase RING1-like [Senna tora]|uniref:E3 ubiquitin-protein ligase RING1-like n=1 Tax=Senna tora TaxID=362788 RepID=A0A834SQP3_9FABA|nr:E3 ubiquitin-protein ligase RING1-like [Senna tora]